MRGGGKIRAAALAAGFLASALAAAEDGRALLPLTVNHTAHGTLYAVVRDGDVLLKVKDLNDAGVSGFAGRRETLDGEEFVSLASLRTDASYVLDPGSVTLDVNVPPDWLQRTQIDMSPKPPAGIVYSHDTSGFVNYAFNARGSGNSDAFMEGGLSVKGDLLYSSVSRAVTGEITRGLTNYTHDDREHMRRFVAGDTFANAGGLGGALFIGGFNVSRNFDLDPYFVRTPTMSVSGAVTSPSTIDVYVNGSIVRRQEIEPGTFDITSLALPAGTGNAQIVVRDAFGQEKTLANPFYASADILARGLNEYSVTAGFRRDPIAPGSDGYGTPALMAWQRYGWTDTFTSGLRLEADTGVLSVGESLGARLSFGEIQAEIGSSRDRGRAGTAAAFVFRRIGQVVNFGFFVHAQSADYANLSLRAEQDRPLLESNAFVGCNLGHHANLTAQYNLSDMRDAPRAQRLTLSTSLSLGRSVNLIASGGAAELNGRIGAEAFVGLSWFFGRGTTASVNTQVAARAQQTSIGVQKSLPLGTGLGYRIDASSSDSGAGGSGAVQYQTPFGRYEARFDHANGVSASSVSIAGGVVALGGTVSLTAPVGESYALIRVPGVADVTALSSNQPIARTNRKGNVVVPNLMPYYGNRLGIEDKDLPLDYLLGATEKTVAPPYRGGAVVTFSALRIRGIRGTIAIDTEGNSAPAAYGELTLDSEDTRYDSPLGSAGEFELENVPAGRYTAIAVSPSGTCRLTIEIPESGSSIVELGTLRCVPERRS